MCALFRIFDFDFCSKKGYNVESYGTGSVVKLPGPASEQPNVYSFGTTYEFMYQDLLKKDPLLYPFEFHIPRIYTLPWFKMGNTWTNTPFKLMSVALPSNEWLCIYTLLILYVCSAPFLQVCHCL